MGDFCQDQGMHWNYRLCRDVDADEEYFSIREVFYNEKNEIIGWTAEPVSILGDTAENFLAALDRARNDCMNREVLDLTTTQPAPE